MCQTRVGMVPTTVVVVVIPRVAGTGGQVVIVLLTL